MSQPDMHRRRRWPWIVSLAVVAVLVGLLVVWYKIPHIDNAAARHHTAEQIERQYRALPVPAIKPIARALTPLEKLDRLKSGYPEAPADGDVIGILRLPGLGSDFAEPIIQGVSKADLERGVGHMPRTALPGRLGNTYLAGHNLPWGGVFHDLDRLRVGQHAIIDAPLYRFVYRIDRRVVVEPSEYRMTAPIPGKSMQVEPDKAYLSLQTCTPVYNPIHRLIYIGTLVKVILKDGQVVWRA